MVGVGYDGEFVTKFSNSTPGVFDTGTSLLALPCDTFEILEKKWTAAINSTDECFSELLDGQIFTTC